MLILKKVLTNPKEFLFMMSLLLMVNFANASSERLAQLKRVGQGEMSWLFIDLYQAALYSSSGKYQDKVYPQALKISYRRDIDKDDLVTATQKQWKKLSLDDALYQPWLKKLTQLWPDIQKGDELVFMVETDGGGLFYHNNQLLGGVNSKQFSNAFLSIWLSPKTTEPKLRRQLIGE